MTTETSISFEEHSGITYLVVENDFASARISLFGGQILSFVPKSDNIDRLWVSPHAFLDGKKPIRGGVPVCWPWFADDHGRGKGTLPSHGFLRTQNWHLAQSADDEKGTHLILTPGFTRAAGFEHDSSVRLSVSVGRVLEIALTTTNTGVSAFTYNAALHTYFYVPDIHHTSLTGLHSQFTDKNDNWAVKKAPTPYLFEGEIDRIHDCGDCSVTINIDDEPLTHVHHANNDSVVIWTPWQGAASITDMDAFGFVHMVCVETAVTQGKTLSPGDAHTFKQTIDPGK